ncbi:M48 family metallopeptidase [Bailinhaonella thermotolerans]|uniref:M48 family metallopeptidase n=1 Tax=Bailinhaonella thermotolerans TaxID=1070861 RepID=UPI001F5B3A64|nr:M48 family metallopeptidase [Bailinhaonella thermotolerans]
MSRRDRAVALGALAALVALLAAVVAWTTPWRALPADAPGVTPDPARDFSAAELARSAAFDAAISPPAYISLGLSLVLALVLVLTPVGARVLARLRGPRPVRVVTGTFLVAAVSEVLTIPLGVWSEIEQRAFGLSTQTWWSWSIDRFKNFVVGTLLTALLVLAVVALARRFPRRWWLPAALGGFAFTLAVSFVYPVVVEPVFNEFRPMPASALRDDLLKLARTDGVPVTDVLVADASRRTTALNAYVSGFGATRRIVVYDTLLKSASPAEIRLIAAHELGHAKRGDVLYGTLVGGLGVACGACLLYLLTTSPRLRRRTALRAGAGDPRAAALLVGLITLGTTLGGPAQNLVSRAIEARADAHALGLTRDPRTFVAMQRRLATSNLSDLSPNMIEYAVYSSHPTAAQRIAAARSWARLHKLPEP